MNIEQIAITDLKTDGQNPNVMTPEQEQALVESIKKFGFLVPVIIDQDNVIADGEHRLESLKKLGLVEVPCVRLTNLTEPERKLLRQVMNKLKGSHDYDLDVEEIKRIMELMPKEDIMRYLPDETDLLQEAYQSNHPLIETFDVDQALERDPKYKVELGQVWQLGKHRLMCGDAAVKEDVELLVNGETVDMVFTDPPYGMNLNTDWSSKKSDLKFYEEVGGRMQGNKYKPVIGDDVLFNPTHLFNFFGCKEIFLFGADYYKEFIPKTGSWFVWDKRSNDLTDEYIIKQTDKIYGSCFELVWSKNKHRREIARIKWAGIFGAVTEPDKNKTRVHPTQKPVKLAKWFIEKFSKEEQVIIDSYGGSGFTLIACEQTNRTCFMMELDPQYCSVIIERWENLTGQKAELTNA